MLPKSLTFRTHHPDELSNHRRKGSKALVITLGPLPVRRGATRCSPALWVFMVYR